MKESQPDTVVRRGGGGEVKLRRGILFRDERPRLRGRGTPSRRLHSNPRLAYLNIGGRNALRPVMRSLGDQT